MKHLEGKRVAVLGLALSGQAAARLALAHGGEVYVSDWSVEPSVAARAGKLRDLGARIDLGTHDVEWVAQADLVVVSPGIPPDAPVLRALQNRGVRWISEPEFAFRFFQGPLIAVTGTNGKTTTAALVAHLLRESGSRVALGGNIGGGLGPPASELALLDPPPEWYVLEVSSFQLADIEHFRPDIGVLTNLAPNHLDRYPSVEAYYADKAKLFANARPDSRWVLNGDQPEVERLTGNARGKRYRFSLGQGEGIHAYPGPGELVLEAVEGRREVVPLPAEGLPLLGRHNLANALAAALTARLAGADPDAISRGLASFQPLPHRLQPVGRRGGVLWVNDSKATNVAATVAALNSLSVPLVLLLGGKDKGEDFAPLRAALHGGVRGVVAFGDAGPRLAEALQGAVALRLVRGTFEEAVGAAMDMARPGDLLLLSPACSSFDMFENYEARGRRFAELAQE